MTQEEVAKIVGVSKTTIVNWEKGRVIPRIPELSMLCEIYKIPKDNIFLPQKSTNSRVVEPEKAG